MDKERTKALFIGPLPPPYSGPELGMKLFLESSLKDNFQIEFLKTNFAKSNDKKAKIGLKSAVWTLFFHFRLVWLLITFRPTVVYYPITPTAMGWLGRDAPCLLLVHLYGAKSVIHLRGSHLKLNFTRFGRLARYATRIACRRVGLAIVQAECLRDQFVGLVSADRIRVLPQAIESSEFDREPSDGKPPGNEENLLLFLGNLSYAKGYCDLMEALPKVAAAVPDAKFVFCGSIVEGATGVFFDQSTGNPLEHKSPRTYHEAVMTSELRHNYDWRGVVRGNDKKTLLRSCSFVALPSYSEGFSRALLEAMTVGKPVICSPVGAHKEFIHNGVNGLVVAPGDIEGLASAIVRLLSDSDLRKRIGQNNYKYTRENFDIDVISRKMSEILTEVIDIDVEKKR